jgi:hypothetical protein
MSAAPAGDRHFCKRAAASLRQRNLSGSRLEFPQIPLIGLDLLQEKLSPDLAFIAPLSTSPFNDRFFSVIRIYHGDGLNIKMAWRCLRRAISG